MTLNETEQKYFSHLFSLADVDRDGKVSGKEGAPFLRRSELSDKTLEKIWEVADSQAAGVLGPREFAIAMRLVAHAQNAVNAQKRNNPNTPVVDPEIKIGNIKNVTSLPNFKDIVKPVMFPSAFSSEDILKYDQLFLSADTNKDGFVDGVEAKVYFSKANIPQDKLARIWELSELDGDSRLNYAEFRLAMHLIYWSLKKEELPTQLPAGLVEASKSIPAQFNTNQMLSQPGNQMLNQPGNQMLSQPGNQMLNQQNNQMINQQNNQLGNQYQYSNNQMQFGNNMAGNMAGNNMGGGGFGLQGNFEGFVDNNYQGGNMGNQGYYNNGNMTNYNQQMSNQQMSNQQMNNQQMGMVNQGFVTTPVKLSDASVRPTVHQYALPAASFETRANFQNDLSQAMNARQKK